MELDEIDKKLLNYFPGMIVRKDLATKFKGAFPVPTYVLEFLLGKYCSNPDEEVINAGLTKVKETLENHYLNPEKTEAIKSKIKELGSFKILDRLKIRLIPSEDKYWGQVMGLNLNFLHIPDETIKKNERMFLDGVWGISDIGYDSTLSRKGVVEPFFLNSFQPVQLSSHLVDKIIDARKNFTKLEWIAILLRSIGLEPTKFTPRQQMLLLGRLIAFIERNVNFVEFGPRSTGKSFCYREISPHSLLISGGQTSIANLFVSNVGTGKVGLVSLFDVVAFDEVAGLGKFNDTTEIQIFKDYMESGSFSRGKGEFTGKASLVFVGNMDADIQTAIQNSHLFIPFPYELQDLAFLDRFHMYLPGWELPRFTPDMFAKNFGFIVDLIAEYFQVMRNKSFFAFIEKQIEWGADLDQRDKIRVRAITSGFLKLIYPDGNFTTDELEECVGYALEFRRRVKEQLRKMGSVEFRRTNFSYRRKSDKQEFFVETPELALAKQFSPLGEQSHSGIGFTLGLNEMSRYSLYRIEVGLRKGRGNWNATGLAGKPIKEALITVRDFVKANLKRITPKIEEHDIQNYDVHVQIVDLMKAHQGSQTGLGFFITVLSAFTKISLKPKLVVVGEMTISGALIPIQNLAEIILIGKENGAQSVLLPENSSPLLAQVPQDILENIEVIIYKDPIDAWSLAKVSDTPDYTLQASDVEIKQENVQTIEKAEDIDQKLYSHLEKVQSPLSQLIIPPIPVTEKKYDCIVVLDGSNIARNRRNSKEGNIKDVLRLRDMLIQIGIPNDQINIIFGSGLRHHIPENEKTLFEALLHESNISQAPIGTDDDWFIIQFAQKKNALIVTNDFYKDYRTNHPDTRNFLTSHSIRYSFLGDEIIFEEKFQEKLNQYQIE